MIQSGVVRTKTTRQSHFSTSSQSLATPSNHPYWYLYICAATAELSVKPFFQSCQLTWSADLTDPDGFLVCVLSQLMRKKSAVLKVYDSVFTSQNHLGIITMGDLVKECSAAGSYCGMC